MSEVAMIKFKLTTSETQIIELAYEEGKTMGEYVDDLSELFDLPSDTIKLVFKGKILTWKQKAKDSKLENGTVMVVVNTVKKSPKKVSLSICRKSHLKIRLCRGQA